MADGRRRKTCGEPSRRASALASTDKTGSESSCAADQSHYPYDDRHRRRQPGQRHTRLYGDPIPSVPTEPIDRQWLAGLTLFPSNSSKGTCWATTGETNGVSCRGLAIWMALRRQRAGSQRRCERAKRSTTRTPREGTFRLRDSVLHGLHQPDHRLSNTTRTSWSP